MRFWFLALLGLGLVSAEDEHFLDVRQIVKGTIEAMSRLPNAALQVNSTETSKKEQPDELYKLFKLPADIMTNLAVNAGYMDQPASSTYGPWIVTKHHDDDEESTSFKQSEDDDSWEEVKPRRKKHHHKKKPENDGLVAISDLLPKPLTAQAPGTAPLPAPPTSQLGAPTFAQLPKMPMLPALPMLSSSQVKEAQGKLAYKPVVQPNGETYYMPVMLPATSQAKPQSPAPQPQMLPPLPGFPAPPAPSFQPTQQQTPFGAMQMPQSDPIQQRFVPQTTPKPRSSSSVFAPPTFPPMINPFMQAASSIDSQKTVKTYPPRYVRPQSVSPTVRQFAPQMPMDDSMMPQSRQSKNDSPNGANSHESTKDLPIHVAPTLEKQDVSSEPTTLYSEEVSPQTRLGHRLSFKAKKETLLRVKSTEDRHLSSVNAQETSKMREIASKKKNNSAEDEEEEVEYEEEEEFVTPPPAKKRRLRKYRRAHKKRVTKKEDDEEKYYGKHSRDTDSAEIEISTSVHAPKASPASEDFEKALESIPSDSEESMEKHRLARLKAKLAQNESGYRLRRVHSSKTLIVPRRRHRTHHHKKTTRKTEESLPMPTELENMSIEESADKEETPEKRVRKTKKTRRHRHRSHKNLHRHSRQDSEEQEVEEDNHSSVDHKKTRTRKMRRHHTKVRDANHQRTVILLQKWRKERENMLATTRTEIPRRPHCMNIRSFARQFLMEDVTQFAHEHCKFVENYYPELKCDDVERYMKICRDYYL